MDTGRRAINRPKIRDKYMIKEQLKHQKLENFRMHG